MDTVVRNLAYRGSYFFLTFCKPCCFNDAIHTYSLGLGDIEISFHGYHGAYYHDYCKYRGFEMNYSMYTQKDFYTVQWNLSYPNSL